MRAYLHLLDQAEGDRRTVEDYIREARGMGPVGTEPKYNAGFVGNAENRTQASRR
ncbi:MAG: hypothetical protein QG596_1111 [Actinomycetota bacterium]|jgi:hypothetical protein|nr:hypothetical protein [Actinomycetota bacterium]